MLEGRLPPGGVLQEFRELPERPQGDTDAAEGSGPEPVPRLDGAPPGEGAERARDEEDAVVVGPDVVRDRRRHRSRNLRAHWPRG